MKPPTVILAVDDVARSAKFYQDVFGWPVRMDAGVIVELELPGGGGLAMYLRSGFARNVDAAAEAVARPPVGDAGVTGTELYVPRDDLEATLGRLNDAGARLLSPLSRRDWGDEAAYFADPDGNVVAVARPWPAARLSAPAGGRP